MTMRQEFFIGAACGCAVLAIAAGQMIPSFFSGRLPQSGDGGVLSLVLGDARIAFSDVMLRKADEYFHGGVHVVHCEHGLTSKLHGQHDAHDEDVEASEDHHPDEAVTPPSLTADPWAWLDSQVHVQTHRHTQGDETRELMPWLWVACRASPQNIEAYETTAYVLDRMLKRTGEAALLLEEGIRKNPADASLELSLGKLYLHRLHDEPKAQRALEAAYAKSRLGPGHDSEDDRFLRGNILFYLGYLANQRGDIARARAYLAEAEALDPNHIGTRNLRKLLSRK